MTDYAHPDRLVSTDWVEEHKSDPDVRLVEVDVDTEAYDTGHIAGAVGWNWSTQLQDPVVRTVAGKENFERLLGDAGISNGTTVVFYGDNNNWFAAYALWLLEYYGHEKLKLMNGGRKKWELEGRPLTTDPSRVEKTNYRIESANEAIRTYRDSVMRTVETHDRNLVDVRSPDEFTGKILAPPALLGREGCQRGGHIPGAKNIPWVSAVNDDGTFKSRDELTRIYGDQGITEGEPTTAYCRIGERSAHTWYVLTHLLGHKDVKNYDGSWTEWGNLINAPIEK